MKLFLIYSTLFHAFLVSVAFYFLDATLLSHLKRIEPVEFTYLNTTLQKSKSRPSNHRSSHRSSRILKKGAKPSNPAKAQSLNTESVADSREENSGTCLQEIQSQIRSLLEYPSSLRRRGVQGQVVLRFEADLLGRLEKIEISKSSGHSELDRLARAAIQKAGPFECLGFSAKKMGKFSLNLPIDFKISDESY